MRRPAIGLAAVSMLVIVAGHARAELKTAQVLAMMKSPDAGLRELGATTLKATESGLSWANAALGNRRQTRLYCPPGQLALTTAQLADILTRASLSDGALGDTHLGHGMLLALQKLFPCPAER